MKALAVAEVAQHGRRRPTVLTLDLDGARAAIAELRKAERVLLAAAAAAEDAAPQEAPAAAEPEAAAPQEAPAAAEPEAAPAPAGEDPPGPATWRAAGLPRRGGGPVRKAEIADAAGGHHVLTWGDPEVDEILAVGGVLLRTFDEAPPAACAPLPWVTADDKSHWRTELPGGRTAVIRRAPGEDGESSPLFVPAVCESALDFAAGPECDWVLAAASWCSEYAARPRGAARLPERHAPFCAVPRAAAPRPWHAGAHHAQRAFRYKRGTVMEHDDPRRRPPAHDPGRRPPATPPQWQQGAPPRGYRPPQPPPRHGGDPWAPSQPPPRQDGYSGGRPERQPYPQQEPYGYGQQRYPRQQQLPPVFPPGYGGRPDAQGYWPPPQPPAQQGYAPRPPQRPRKSRKGPAFLVFGGIGALVVLVAALASSHPSSPSHSSSARQTQAAPAASTAAAKAAPQTVTYVVTGSAADVTYGPAGTDLSGSVPMDKTAGIPSSPPLYYSVQAQLQGGGTVSCEIKVGGTVVSSSTASGGYNIAGCEIVQDLLSGQWQDANS